MAKEQGPFAGFGQNREAMLRVIRNHRRAAHGEKRDYEELSVRPVPLDASRVPLAGLAEAAARAWDEALEAGERYGFRNAQTTVIAPTGTIGLVMDCDTTGIEPDFALVKFKKLAGGGYFKIINRMVPRALAQARLRGPAGRGHRALRGRPRHARGRPRDQPREPGGQGLHAGDPRAARARSAERVRHQVRLQPVHPRPGVLPRGAAPHRRAARRRRPRPPDHDRLHAGAVRGGEPLLLRRHDPGGRAASEGRASGGVRLRQSLRPARQALPLDREPYPHDGGGAAVHQRRDLQDHQHAGDCRRRGLLEGLSRRLAAQPEGAGPLSRRLQAVAAARVGDPRGTRRGRG